jgi:hypothetical protein
MTFQYSVKNILKQLLVLLVATVATVVLQNKHI